MVIRRKTTCRIKTPDGGYGFISRPKSQPHEYCRYLGAVRRGRADRLKDFAFAENLLAYGAGGYRVRLVKHLLETRIAAWDDLIAVGSKSPQLAAGWDRLDRRALAHLERRIADAT